MKKRISVLLAASMAAGLVSGSCLTVSAEEAQKDVSLKVLMSAGWTDIAIKEIEPQLKEQGITLEVEAYDWNTYEGKQRLAGTSKGGEYDVIFLPGNAVNTFAQAGALIPVNDVVEEIGFDDEDYYGSVKKFSKVNDDWYIAPYSAESMVYYYRTDLISEDQLPTTIDEMYALGQEMTSGDTYGLAILAGAGEAACSFWSYFLWSYGGDYFDDEWNPTLNTPEQSKVAENVSVAAVPAGPEGAKPRFGTWGVGITANCKDVEAGKEVLKAFCGKENIEANLASSPAPVKSLNEAENIQDINYTIPANAATLDAADERPAIPELNLYIPAVGAAINSVVSGNPAQEVLDSLNEEVRGIMEDGGYYD